nr:hypothetical protein [Burkholderia sp. IMCC1007]
MLVTLDGQIGREKYQSVAGSVFALQRFAAALCARADAAVDAPAVAGARRKTRPGWPRLRHHRPATRGRLHGAHRHACACRGAGRLREPHALCIT